ncbi:MAG: aminopeptidase P family protein [Mesorhizobium sp.]|nr:MAG: aminopeptidase P family protein [Mesorhizobium sp.]
MNATDRRSDALRAPFDTDRLAALMEEADIDILLATSKHNVQYLLGGYQFNFFSTMDALAHSRYLPFVIYEKGRPERTAYIASRMESAEHQARPFWTPRFQPVSWGTLDATGSAIEHLRATGRSAARVGIEPGFLPMDAYQMLRDKLEDASFVDATAVMERLRAIKSPRELSLLRKASDLITESMLATIAWAHEGSTKSAIARRLATEQTSRGLHFDYCFLAMGSSHALVLSDQKWQPGEVISLDSGGNYAGYIGDLCRMGVLGEPDAELVDLLGEVDAIQRAAISRVRAGCDGREIIATAETVRKASKVAGFTDFMAHGMGLVAHEAPFLMTNHPIEYAGVDADRPLEAGMVVSIETTMKHPRRGLIKLEDTIAVTSRGHEMYGQSGRSWNPGGSR